MYSHFVKITHSNAWFQFKIVQMYSVFLYQVGYVIIIHLFKVFVSLWSCFWRLVVALETVIDMIIDNHLTKACPVRDKNQFCYRESIHNWMIIDICIPFVLSDHMCTLHIWLEKLCHPIVLSWLSCIHVSIVHLHNKCKSIQSHHYITLMKLYNHMPNVHY